MSELICVNGITAYDGFDRDRRFFLSYMSAKGRKDTTIRTYDEALKSVYRTLDGMGLHKDPRLLTEDDIIQLKDALNVSETSKKLYLIALGRFIEVLTGENIIKDMDLLWNQCEHRRLFISADEFRAMVSDCTMTERLVLMFGAYMGLRRSEIANIRLSDIKGNMLTVHGKGHGKDGKVSHLKIPRPLMACLETYLDVRDGESDYLLINESGKHKGEPISSGALGALIDRVAKRNDVEMTPHSLRRLYATTLYDVGTDLNTIRQMMRHNSITTTIECYINVNPVQKDKAVDALCAVLNG